MKIIVNPLNYPIAVLIAGVSLFVGVRVVNLPSKVTLPATVVIAFVSGSVLANKGKGEQNRQKLDNKELEQELELIQKESLSLIEKAEELKREAKNLLHEPWQMDLLTAVEFACDRTEEIPNKISNLISKISGGDSLLSIDELNKKLQETRNKKQKASGVALEQLEAIELNLIRNINLAKQGESARQAQVFSLTNLITNSAGILQQLQNKFRTADLTNSQELKDLQSLSQELASLQENDYLLEN